MPTGEGRPAGEAEAPGEGAPTGEGRPAEDAPDQPAEVARPAERGNRAIAALLAVAAVVAAIITARASFVSSDASGNWQTALRTEVKRSAGAVEDARYLYQTELPLAMAIAEARLRQQQFESAGNAATSATQQALLLESSVQASLVSALESASDLASNATYALPSGGFDVGRRLTDLRAQAPDLVGLDPDAPETRGDALAEQGERLTTSAVPIGVCVLVGVLAQPFVRWRRHLLVSGFVALAIGIVLALSAGVIG